MAPKRTAIKRREALGPDGLTDKQRAFIEQYLTCWNATEAARRAGYSAKTAQQMGSENLSKPVIRAAIDARLGQYAMSANEVLARLSDLATADMGDFLTVRGSSVRLDLKGAKARGKLHLVKKFSEKDGVISIELHDAKDALVQVGRYHGLFTDRVAGEIETLTSEQIEARRMERWQKAGPLLGAMLAKAGGNE